MFIFLATDSVWFKISTRKSCEMPLEPISDAGPIWPCFHGDAQRTGTSFWRRRWSLWWTRCLILKGPPVIYWLHPFFLPSDEGLMTTNHLRRPGISISVDWGALPLMTSWKSSMEAEIVSKLMLVVGFAMVLKGSSCLSNKVTYCYSMVFFVSRIWEKLNGIWTWM